MPLHASRRGSGGFTDDVVGSAEKLQEHMPLMTPVPALRMAKANLG
jgi:hypothetical protein